MVLSLRCIHVFEAAIVTGTHQKKAEIQAEIQRGQDFQAFKILKISTSGYICDIRQVKLIFLNKLKT